jgi:hypothetical protein
MINYHKSNNVLSSNYFEVVNEISIKSAEVLNQAKATYDIVLKAKSTQKHEVEVTRLKFAVNDKAIANKFPMISNFYFESIFPLKFILIGDVLKLSNFKEIQKSVAKTDSILKEKYNGDGLEYIRGQFLDQIETEEKAEQFISSLSIINCLNLSLKRFCLGNVVDFNWKIPTVGILKFELKPQQVGDSCMHFSANELNKIDFLQRLNQYRLQNKYESIKEIEDTILTADFLSKIKYEEGTLNIIELNSKLEIKLNDYFQFEENITIKSLL